MNWDQVIQTLLAEAKEQRANTETKKGLEALIFAASVMALCSVVKALQTGLKKN